MDIDEKNYEEFLIRQIENDLSANEQETLFVFLEKHPEYRRELELFEQTRMIPDETISFGDTSSLKRTIIPFSLNNWLIWSSAAAAILVMIYFKFLNPEMTGVNSVVVKQNAVTTRSTQPVAVNNPNTASSGNANSISATTPNLQNLNPAIATNRTGLQPADKQNSLSATQIQNPNSIQPVAVVQSPGNAVEAIQAANSSASQNSISSTRQSTPITAMNAENENPGNVRLNEMYEIIPAAYVNRKREILVSKVPDVYYVPLASGVTRQSQQGSPFKDLASLFKAAANHSPLSETSFYQHSAVGKLLATQVVYEHQ